MLSPDHRAIVSSTVPLLEAGGEALVRHFYRTLFAEFPEVGPYFNQANQQRGAQQRALADAILAYAKNIEKLERLGPAVTTIVNKHVSLQIQPHHYPMVGASLLKSIREVLGVEVATDAVLEAWGAAYGQLAEILIGAEQSIYATQASTEGGWTGEREFTVAQKTIESAEITSFVLEPCDGGPVMHHAPGQYIGLAVVVDGVQMRRQYSLSAAANGRSYRISVKREHAGQVSTFLHDRVAVGDRLALFPPAGAFVLKDNQKPLVLISGGVGITPTLAMIDAAVSSGREIHFIHAARDGNVHAFRDHIDGIAQCHAHVKRFYCHEREIESGGQPDAVGYIDTALLRKWLPESRDIEAYFLGPVPFMASVKRSLLELGVPAEQTYFEFFGPATALA